MDINNPDNRSAVIRILKDGYQGEFWQLLVQSIDEKIEGVQASLDGDDFREYPAEDYKIEREILKAQKSDLEALKELPNSIFSSISDEPDDDDEADPYRRARDFVPKK